MNGRQRVGTEATAQFQGKIVTFAVDMPVGTLFALSQTDSNVGVVADNSLAYPAVGFIEMGSVERFGEAHADEPNRPLYIGDSQKVYLNGLLDLGVNTFTDAEVSSQIPIYEGVSGGWTKIKPTTGKRARVLGFPRDKATIYIDFTIDRVGVIV